MPKKATVFLSIGDCKINAIVRNPTQLIDYLIGFNEVVKFNHGRLFNYFVENSKYLTL